MTCTPPPGVTLTFDVEPSGFVLVAVIPEGLTETLSLEGSAGACGVEGALEAGGACVENEDLLASARVFARRGRTKAAAARHPTTSRPPSAT